MQGDKKVIEYLNAALKNELTSINQYFLHYRILDNWGIAKLAEFERGESIDEMKHADRLIERILYLEGYPNLQSLKPLRIGETVEEILAGDLALERDAMKLLREAIPHAESVGDFGSRALLVDIVTSEEEHIDFLETQQKMIADQGLQNYIQLQSAAAG